MKKFFIILGIILATNYAIAVQKEYKKHYEKAKVYLKNKMYEEAIKEYKKVVQLKPDFTEIYLKIGICYDQYLHKYSEAVKYYLEYIEKKGKKSDQIKKIIRNIVNLKYVTTDREFAQIKKGVEFYNKGVETGKSKKFDKAIEYFKKSLEIIPHYVKANYAIGIAYFNTKDYANAYNHLLYAIKVDPNNPEIKEAYFKLGLLADDLFLKDYELAEDFYKKYIKLRGSRISEAKKLLSKIEEVDDLILSAAKLYKNKNYKLARQELEKALSIKPFDIRVINNLGIIYLREKKYQEAITQFRKALEIRDNVPDTYYNLACVYSKKGDTKTALRYFKKGIKYFSKDMIKKVLKDKDLENLRKEKEFQKLIKNKN